MTRNEFIERAAIAMAGNKEFTNFGKLRYSEIAENAVSLANRMDLEVDWD